MSIPYTRLLLSTLVQLQPHNNSKEKTWPGRGQSFSPSRCGCHQRTHPKRTPILRVCKPDGGASPLVWSHQIPEAVSTRTRRDRAVNTNASRLGPVDQLGSRFSHAFCRLAVQSPMIYRQGAKKTALADHDGWKLKIRQGSSFAVTELTRPSVSIFRATGLKLFKLLSILHMAWLLVFVV